MNQENNFKNIENKESEKDLNKEKTPEKNISNEISSSKRIERIDADIISAEYRILETRKKVRAIRDQAGLPYPLEVEVSPNEKIELEYIKKLKAEKAELELMEQGERREVANGFARELRNTPEGTFYPKLKRLAAAFVLAGISIFEPGQALAPEFTKQARALTSIHGMDTIKKDDPELYKNILEQFQEKGGVTLSSQTPETTYRPEIIPEIMDITDPPFYNRPEVILGKEFIKENPEKAKEYLEKIYKAMKATVKIRGEKGNGSGVLIKGKGGKTLILTNEHVTDQASLKVDFINKDGTMEESEITLLAKDEDNDIAVLEFKGNEKDSARINKLLALKVKDKFSIKSREKMASIGHPFGFPYSVGIAEAIRIPESPYLYAIPDKRFTGLEMYSDKGELSFKGDGIPGMSGGPVIWLEQEDDVELAGLNMGTFNLDLVRELVGSGSLPNDGEISKKLLPDEPGSPSITIIDELEGLGFFGLQRLSKMVTSDQIVSFLKKHDLYDKQ